MPINYNLIIFIAILVWIVSGILFNLCALYSMYKRSRLKKNKEVKK